MTAAVVARAGVAVVAVAAVVWLALGLHAARLANEGRGGTGAQAKRLDAREVERRRSLLQRSLAHNADTDPLVREAALLAFAGRPDEGLPLLRRVVDREPENYEAWGQIVLAARDSEPALARRARARALELNPRAGR